MHVFDDAGSLAPLAIWDGVTARTVEGANVTFALVELEAGSIVPEHRHVNEQIGMLIAGSLTFTIGGEARELGPGGTWRIDANVPHSVAVGPDGASLAEVFAPARDDWADVARLEPSQPRFL